MSPSHPLIHVGHGDVALAICHQVLGVIDHFHRRIVFDHRRHLHPLRTTIHRYRTEHHLLGAVRSTIGAGDAVGIRQIAGHHVQTLRLCRHPRTRHIKNVK